MTISLEGKKNTDFVSIRDELIYIMDQHLMPLTKRYPYTDNSLTTNLRWKPIILVVGNYSSGKSTLVNEFLGVKVQQTSQAPTDDRFTLITSMDENDNISSTSHENYDEKDGYSVINNNNYPFARLKRYGSSLAAHFSLKKVASPVLSNCAIIDTPGLLDLASEKKRSYDYNQVICDLAAMSDLILVLFDPHRMDTIQSVCTSVNPVLGSDASSNKIVYILNRIDECKNVKDLMRVYGNLCWNLAQSIEKNAPPKIYLTYANKFSPPTYLEDVCADKNDINKLLARVPQLRLDHMFNIVSSHTDHLKVLLEEILSFKRSSNNLILRSTLVGTLLSMFVVAACNAYIYWVKPWGNLSEEMLVLSSLGAIAVLIIIWILICNRLFYIFFRSKYLHKLGKESNEKLEKNLWIKVKNAVITIISNKGSLVSLKRIKKDLSLVMQLQDHDLNELQQIVNQVSNDIDLSSRAKEATVVNNK